MGPESVQSAELCIISETLQLEGGDGFVALMVPSRNNGHYSIGIFWVDGSVWNEYGSGPWIWRKLPHGDSKVFPDYFMFSEEKSVNTAVSDGEPRRRNGHSVVRMAGKLDSLAINGSDARDILNALMELAESVVISGYHVSYIETLISQSNWNSFPKGVSGRRVKSVRDLLENIRMCTATLRDSLRRTNESL